MFTIFLSYNQTVFCPPSVRRLVMTVSSTCFFPDLQITLCASVGGFCSVQKSRKSKTKHCENIQLAFLWRNKTVFKIQIEYKTQIEKQRGVKLKFCQPTFYFFCRQEGNHYLWSWSSVAELIVTSHPPPTTNELTVRSSPGEASWKEHLNSKRSTFRGGLRLCVWHSVLSFEISLQLPHCLPPVWTHDISTQYWTTVLLSYRWADPVFVSDWKY